MAKKKLPGSDPEDDLPMAYEEVETSDRRPRMWTRWALAGGVATIVTAVGVAVVLLLDKPAKKAASPVPQAQAVRSGDPPLAPPPTSPPKGSVISQRLVDPEPVPLKAPHAKVPEALRNCIW